MSSGYNGITIRSVGKIRLKLAEQLCQLTGWLVTAEDLQRTNPNHRHWEDCCAWDCWAVIPGKPFKGHIYSWDTMTECARRGVVVVGGDCESFAAAGKHDIEVCANETK